MLHVVKLIDRRLAGRSSRVAGYLFMLSAAALALGIGLLMAS